VDFKEIKKLVNLVESSEIGRIEIEESGFRIEIEKQSGATVIAAPAAPVIQNLPVAPAASTLGGIESASGSDTTVSDTQHIVTSPMVGTFYSRPSPDDPPFVKEGDEVAAGQVICIIEAMKVMNEIEADVRGIVRQVIVANAQPIQFDEPMFEIEPL
jgi:acetyl-CoA carboxylase biotin carboxyl carrier protein